MRASEYGGSDTVASNGVQPAPHVPTPSEKLRLLYAIDPTDAGAASPIA